MKGVQYLVDDQCQVQAVLIDLKKLGRLWEDFQDIMVSRRRRKERRYSLAQVEARLRERRKIS
jgi:hypothetical protein